jgi:phenylacetate-coenzyme A ligase PaaK-like adenylate-forming protein
MFDTAVAQLRLGLSLGFGVPFNVRAFERVVGAMRDTIEEFGSLGADAADLLKGPDLDAETRQLMQLRRFRKQATRAAANTSYYGEVFERSGIDPRRLAFDEIGDLPITPKEALRNDPDAFVNRAGKPQLRAMTTGTTGWPTSVYFSNDEVRLIVAITASHVLLRRFVDPDDIVQVCLSSRALIAVISVLGSCAKVGAPAYLAGLVEPAHVLGLLSERRSIPGKRPKASVMDIYPSHLGEVVEYGLRSGYGPDDFGLRRLIVGGEVVTAGLKARAQKLFGPVSFEENYATTETVPMGGTQCSAGHLHFELSGGLMEVVSLEDQTPVGPGGTGTIVATPFPPYRDTTLLLRYDTEDVAVPVEGPLECELRDFPATSRLLGKRRLSVRHDDGWTFPRQVMEALESLEQVPLPARFGFWAVPGGVAVEVVARSHDPATRRAIGDALEAQGVPLKDLVVVGHRSELRRPMPMRCDLREQSFARSGPGQAGQAGAADELLTTLGHRGGR